MRITKALLDQQWKRTKMKRLEIGNDSKRGESWETANLDTTTSPTYIAGACSIPVPDGTFDLVYASHILEHIQYASGKDSVESALVEWFRILKPGGTVMIGVPDLEVLCNLYLAHPSDRTHIMRMIYGGQTSKFDFHRVGFDQDLLAAFLHICGFVDIKRVADFGLFKNDCTTLEFNKIRISLNMKAIKP